MLVFFLYVAKITLEEAHGKTKVTGGEIPERPGFWGP